MSVASVPRGRILFGLSSCDGAKCPGRSSGATFGTGVLPDTTISLKGAMLTTSPDLYFISGQVLARNFRLARLAFNLFSAADQQANSTQSPFLSKSFTFIMN